MTRLRRITCFFILISIVFSFTPVFNGHVYAAGKKLKTPNFHLFFVSLQPKQRYESYEFLEEKR